MSGASQPTAGPSYRPVWAEVDLDALRHNTRLMSALVSPAALCAVVKADAYGHGAVECAQAMLEAGARWLAVATVEEGVELRDGGISAPILLLSEPPPDAMDETVRRSLVPTLYSKTALVGAEAAARAAQQQLEVHLKVDTGMHRVGAPPGQMSQLVDYLAGSPSLRFAGLWTHLAVADGPGAQDEEFTLEQLRRFEEVARSLGRAGEAPALLHAANSAAAIRFPRSRLDMVRSGIALYGSLPASWMADALASAMADIGEKGEGLRPVMSLRARVSHVGELDEGDRVSYGRLRPLTKRSLVATVPIGYADGVPREYFPGGGEVLIGGIRFPLAGTVTMDQIMVDCGEDTGVSVGDEVVLIGRQGEAVISAWDWARTLDTISYEVLSRIGPRVPRFYSAHEGPRTQAHRVRADSSGSDRGREPLAAADPGRAREEAKG